MDDGAFAVLRRRTRPGDWIRTDLRKRPDGSARTAADALAVAMGFRALGKDWEEIPADVAVSKIRNRLSISMAYGSKLLSETEADAIAKDFVGLFDPRWHRYLTNWEGHGWTPISDFTIDAAIVGMDAERIGIIVVLDED